MFSPFLPILLPSLASALLAVVLLASDPVTWVLAVAGVTLLAATLSVTAAVLRHSRTASNPGPDPGREGARRHQAQAHLALLILRRERRLSMTHNHARPTPFEEPDMLTPSVTDHSRLSAHRRQVAFVRASLLRGISDNRQAEHTGKGTR